MCANQAIKDKTDMILGFYPSRRRDQFLLLLRNQYYVNYCASRLNVTPFLAVYSLMVISIKKKLQK